MFQKRSLPAFFLMASLGAAATAAVFAPTPVNAAGDYCSTMKKEKVKKACRTAGVTDENGMKKQMKAWAKDAGDEYKKCSTCHKSSTGGDLNEDYVDSKWDDFAKKAGIKYE